MPSQNRLARIHILKKELGLSDDNYRIQLGAYGAPINKKGVPSSAGFSDKEADRFIAALERQKKGAKVSRHGWGKNKYEYLRPRASYMADPKQLRNIEGIWREIADNTSDQALESFVERQTRRNGKKGTGIRKLIWLEKKHVNSVLTALKKMKEELKEKDNG